VRTRFSIACLLASALAGSALAQQGFYTTKQDPIIVPKGTVLPAQNNNAGSAPVLAPPAPMSAPAAPTASGTPPAAAYIPFQRATPYGQQAVPAPLPMNRAVPVENIDLIEVTEPAAPAPQTFEANPVEEDPAAPTEMNAPIFAPNSDTKTPREVVLRVLNKVTAQAAELKAKPGETLQFGQLEITAVQCFQSTPSSLPDTVALLDISEKQPGVVGKPKLLFHGWMYASSPSLTALEHPIYDVTMVDCAMKTKAVDALDVKKPATGKAKKTAN
jgi:hypothetical protein